jgi:uncharacterized YccA/Bax inhibitor family protein
VKTSNPVLTRLGQAAERERAAGYAPVGQYGQSGYDGPYPTTDYPAAPPAVRPMTVDDVVVKTIALLGILGVSATAVWVLVPDSLLGLAAIGGAIVGLVLGLIISFSRMANPALVVAYAIAEGALVGGVSKLYETRWDGIVLQAVTATFGVFFLMAILYKIRALRATPRFVRGLVAAMAGIFAVIVVDLILRLFDINTGLRDGSPLAIGFSLVIIVVAALSFILSFHEVEEGVRMGLPQRYSWVASFGILVSLIWLYLEMLRLISYFQGDD